MTRRRWAGSATPSVEGRTNVRVLVVDEDGRLSGTARELGAADDRLAVEYETDPAAALDRLASEDPPIDCVVASDDLPETDPVSFLSSVRSAYPEVPLVVYAADGDEELASEVLAAGATDYVPEQVERPEKRVARRVVEVVERHRERQVTDAAMTAVETVRDGVAVVDDDGRFDYVNEAFADLHDEDRAALLGTDWRRVVPDDRARVLAEEIHPAVDGGERWGGRWTGVRADGTEFTGVGSVRAAGDGYVWVLQGVEEADSQAAALARERAFTDAVMNALDDVVFVLDAAGELVRWNDRLTAVTGYDDEELAGRPATDFFAGEDAEQVAEAVEQVVVSGAGSVEADLVTADGERIPYEFRGVKLIEDGENAGVCGVGRDVSERHRVEAELREGRETVERLHDVVTRMTEATDEQRVHELTVEAAEEILSFDICVVNVESDGRLPVVAVSGDVPPDGVAPMSVDEGIVGHTYRTKESRVIDDIREVPEANPQGPYRSALSLPIGRFGVFQTVAEEPGAFDERDLELAELLVNHAAAAVERIRRERALEELHAATRDLMAAETTEEVARRVVDAADRVLRFDLASVFAHEGDRLVPVAHGGSVAEVVDAATTFERGEGLVWEAIEAGEPRLYDDVRDHPDVYDEATEVRGEMVLPLGDYGVLLVGSRTAGDFTPGDLALARILVANAERAIEEVRQQRALREREAELARQNERLEEFTAMLSHDLRNPLSVAKGNVDLAREENDSEALATAAAAHERMEALVEDVLTMARHGELVEDPDDVSLSWAVETAAETVELDRTAVEQVGDLPVVRADGDRLVQLLENLFRNAVEHGSTGSQTAGRSGDASEIRVGTLRTDDGDIEGFYVADDGPGIPEDERERVFERGYSTADDGTGFGLAIVRELATAHGWSVSVTDGADGGARIEVRGVDPA